MWAVRAGAHRGVVPRGGDALEGVGHPALPSAGTVLLQHGRKGEWEPRDGRECGVRGYCVLARKRRISISQGPSQRRELYHMHPLELPLACAVFRVGDCLQ